MKKVMFLFLFIGIFFIACSDKGKGITIETPITFDIQPDEQATLEEIRATLAKTTRERDEEGYLKKENFPILIGQTLGLLQKNPGDSNTKLLCFDVAETLKVGRDYKNATKLYLKMSQIFPKSDVVGNALFQVAYMQENKMDDANTAIINYSYFLSNYPNHPHNRLASKRLEKLTRY